MPKLHLKNALAQTAIGGWTLGGTFLFHSGYPFSVVNSGVRSAQGIRNLNGIATNTFLADYISTQDYPTCSAPNVACMSPGMFAKSANQHDFGNIPRNNFRGPNYFDADVNIYKDFSIKERAHMRIGMYLYNVLNHPNFDNPNNNLAGGNFSTITNTVSAPNSPYGNFQGGSVSGRIMQTQVKFSF